MDLESADDVNMLIKIKETAKIKKLEFQIRRLSYVPFITSVIMVCWGLWTIWSTNDWSMGHHTVIIAVAIAATGSSINMRSDLQHQLAQLSQK